MAEPNWFFYVVGTINLADCTESADPACLTFQHRVVWAVNEGEARQQGQRMLGFQQEAGVIKNDYVFPVKLA